MVKRICWEPTRLASTELATSGIHRASSDDTYVGGLLQGYPLHARHGLQAELLQSLARLQKIIEDISVSLFIGHRGSQAYKACGVVIV